MIRKYNHIDFEAIDSNGLTFGFDIKMLEIMENFTIESNGLPVCIISFIEYSPSKYTGFIYADKKFNSLHAIELKTFVEQARNMYNMTRFETTSLDCNILNRWHSFLGFECEGVKKNYIDNKDFRMWRMLWA